MKLLLAEDERQAGEYLVKGLGENGWIVDWVHNGVDAVHMAGSAEYDVIVLDVGLPKMDGWEAIKRIRHDNRTPVLFLTARDRVEDRVRGLELGADDYLVKPFAFSELLARVRALARRGKQQEPDVLRVADLEVQLLRRRVATAAVADSEPPSPRLDLADPAALAPPVHRLCPQRVGTAQRMQKTK